MKLLTLSAATMVQIILAGLAFGGGSPADATTPLSSEPAFNSRVVRLGHSPSAEARARLVVTTLTQVGGRHIDV